MGWLFMQSLGGYFGPRQYLDAQFTYERPDHRSKVIRSALIALRTYYAAVERITLADGAREVWGLICLVRYNPRNRKGEIFGYKDMSESMGPCEQDCPKAILDLLTPTDNSYAIEWRAGCRARLDQRRALSKKPSPRPGQIIEFDQPLLFKDGMSSARFEVVSNPRSHRTVLFRVRDRMGLYRIASIKKYTYRLLDPPP